MDASVRCSKRSFCATYISIPISQKVRAQVDLALFVTLHPNFPMLIYRSPGHRTSRNANWRQVLQGKIQAWVRQQIITDDPFDEEPLYTQRIYEELQQLELARVPIPFQSSAKLRKPQRLDAQP
jgi:hypothetical protein